MTTMREPITRTAAESLPMGLGLGADEILNDYRLAYRSRQASVVGRREVMSGKAKFGIFGDGKEIPQVAMARAFRPGDIRSGYYRDQTLIFALGMGTLDEYFAQLYAHADVTAEPATAGRAMNAHFATRMLDDLGEWVDLTARPHSSADVSPTGTQMPRLVGLAYASRLYRELPELAAMTTFSKGGREVAWGTVGNATCAEGLFWESVNAIGVLGGACVISIWDDNYGISVPNELQVTKGDLSALLAGFRREMNGPGYELFTVRGWDYPELLGAYDAAARLAREEHVPVLIHVTELTQPQGHSTSGSHERYKSKARLEWEAAHDGLARMRQWLQDERLVAEEDLAAMEADDRRRVEDARERAWRAFRAPLDAEVETARGLIARLDRSGRPGVKAALERLGGDDAQRRDVLAAVVDALVATHGWDGEERRQLHEFREAREAEGRRLFGSHLLLEGDRSALAVPEVAVEYGPDAPTVMGFEVVNACFDAALASDPRVIAFGQDVGQLGDVNQGFRGLQAKYGPLRVSDTGIREATILGQAIGMAMRGLRPIAEIQYLDYLLYALQIMSDDLATLTWRTAGGQKAPVIVRTRGHRLEGIWHSGSPMAGVMHLVRGMHVCVPRNMTQAAGMYNTLLAADDPALVIEVLNGYRLHERLPSNPGEFTVPLGRVEVLRPGRDVTLVTYGACCRIAMEAAALLADVGIDVEVIDAQTLLPFDTAGQAAESVAKTGRLVCVDEDVPGGASATLLTAILETQAAYRHLDSEPRTVTAAAHRPAYGSDGDYFSKPNREDVFRAVYSLMSEVDPRRFPDP